MTAKHNRDPRPTSPHLQIYAWNVSSFTSIFHRFTGVALYFSIIAIAWYVVLYAYKIDGAATEEHCECEFLNTVFFVAAAFVIFALYYHFCNGIRHLFWDIGKGFDIKTARKTGLLVIFMATLFTVLTIGFASYFKFM